MVVHEMAVQAMDLLAFIFVTPELVDEKFLEAVRDKCDDIADLLVKPYHLLAATGMLTYNVSRIFNQASNGLITGLMFNKPHSETEIRISFFVSGAYLLGVSFLLAIVVFGYLFALVSVVSKRRILFVLGCLMFLSARITMIWFAGHDSEGHHASISAE